MFIGINNTYEKHEMHEQNMKTKHEKHGKYLHNGIMHNIGTQLIYYCFEFLFLKA